MPSRRLKWDTESKRLIWDTESKMKKEHDQTQTKFPNWDKIQRERETKYRVREWGKQPKANLTYFDASLTKVPSILGCRSYTDQ